MLKRTINNNEQVKDMQGRQQGTSQEYERNVAKNYARYVKKWTYDLVNNILKRSSGAGAGTMQKGMEEGAKRQERKCGKKYQATRQELW